MAGPYLRAGWPLPRESFSSAKQPTTPCSRASERHRRLSMTGLYPPFSAHWVLTGDAAADARQVPRPPRSTTSRPPGVALALHLNPHRSSWFQGSLQSTLARGLQACCMPDTHSARAMASSPWEGALRRSQPSLSWGCKHGACLTPVPQRLWLPALGRGLAFITAQEESTNKSRCPNKQVTGHPQLVRHTTPQPTTSKTP
jgi:hypothetical protein